MVKYDHRSDRTYQDVLLCLRNMEIPQLEQEIDLVPSVLESSNIYEPTLLSNDLEARLVELACLYRRLCFSESTDQLIIFAALRIEFRMDCQKAKQYVELFQKQLSNFRANPYSKQYAHLLSKYRLVLERSIFVMCKLIGWSPSVQVWERVQDTKISLEDCVKAMSDLNSEAAAIISPHSANLFGAPSRANTLKQQIQTMANMTIAQSLGTGQGLIDFWVDKTSLFIGEFPEPRNIVPYQSVLQRLVGLWSGNKLDKIRLRPRQYGILKLDGVLEDVMVEFRPYLPQELSHVDYAERRAQVGAMAKMLSAARNPETSDPFPCLEFRCLSEITDRKNPAFLLVFSSRGVNSLSELIHEHHQTGSGLPTPRIRQQLALGLAKAVLTLHLAGHVHGAVSTENVFFKFGDTHDEHNNTWRALKSPLLAGLEITRDRLGPSDRIDVEDPDLRVYLHPERQGFGSAKAEQTPRFDTFSLGMVLVEIGLWKRFQSFQKYQEARNDQERQSFAKRLRKSFSHPTAEGFINMGRSYEAIISYCLADSAEKSETAPSSMPDSNSILLGSPNGMELVALLEQQLG